MTPPAITTYVALTLLAFAGLSSPATAADYERAGAIICTVDGGKPCVLLGHDRFREKWTNFVGGPKPVDNGKSQLTARREVREETKCKFKHNFDPRVSFAGMVGYPLWVAKWDDVPIGDLRNNPAPPDCEDAEMNWYVLVELKDIEHLLTEWDGKGKDVPLPAEYLKYLPRKLRTDARISAAALKDFQAEAIRQEIRRLCK